MKKFFLLSIASMLFANLVSAQDKKVRAVDNFAEVTGGIGAGQGTGALAYVYNWKLGKKKRIELGLGVKFTSYFASNLYFTTAPAKLTTGKTNPTVLFSGDIVENIDSVLFQTAQVNALNISLNLGYNVSKKFYVGFTIDAIGFSFGKKQNGIYYGNNFAPGVPVKAKPTAFNLLLISDNDRGSLNSELFVRYKWNDTWGVKLGYQYLFVEYTADSKVQTTPGGDMNDRFRKKMAGVGLGLTYNFKK